MGCVSSLAPLEIGRECPRMLDPQGTQAHVEQYPSSMGADLSDHLFGVD